MRKFLGQVGGATARPFFPAAAPILLISAAIFLVLPETANAQIWVSSGFKTGPGAQQETAYCSTSAIDPTTGQPSPAAADYELFIASCSVTPSSGSVITSAQCSANPYDTPAGSTAEGNPTGQCSINFTPQPGVTYTINSYQGFFFNLDPAGTQCGPGEFVCYSDPLGYYSMNPSLANPWPASPTYSSDTASLTVDETCSARGGVCVPQTIPEFTAYDGESIEAPRDWLLAQTSATYTACNLPTTETTAFQGWDTAESQPTVGLWEQTSTDSNGDDFSGNQVQEMSPTVGEDTCYFYDPNNPSVQLLTAVTGGNWIVGDDNTWGPDKVGWTTVGVAYYRTNGRAPCSFTVYQQMQMQCSDNNWYNYGLVNTLQGIITATTVTSVRAGGTATRRY